AQATAAARQLRSLAAAARDDRPQQQGRRGVCRAPHRLRDLLQELQQTLDLHVRRHGAALHVGLPAEELQVDTDPGPLLQILCDLVDDALESPRASRHIDMRCRTVGNMAIVFVGNDRPPDAANDPSPSPASRQISGRSRHRCPRHDRTVDRSGALATELLATALGGHLGRLRRGPFATVSWLAVPLAIGKPGGPAA
ncbi:MAG: HAMP domain-containing histidine kinase, partial [Planctomycetes bacterium]|nr:HAMP domain-containing histidine kinase [Planctomycetota bacterium]